MTPPQALMRLVGRDSKGERIDQFVDYGGTVKLDVPGGRVEFRHHGAAESGLVYAHLTYVPIKQGLTTFGPRIGCPRFLA